MLFIRPQLGQPIWIGPDIYIVVGHVSAIDQRLRVGIEAPRERVIAMGRRPGETAAGANSPRRAVTPHPKPLEKSMPLQTLERPNVRQLRDIDEIDRAIEQAEMMLTALRAERSVMAEQALQSPGITHPVTRSEAIDWAMRETGSLGGIPAPADFEAQTQQLETAFTQRLADDATEPGRDYAE